MEAVAVGDEKMDEDGGGGNVNEESVGGRMESLGGACGIATRENATGN